MSVPTHCFERGQVGAEYHIVEVIRAPRLAFGSHGDAYQPFLHSMHCTPLLAKHYASRLHILRTVMVSYMPRSGVHAHHVTCDARSEDVLHRVSVGGR